MRTNFTSDTYSATSGDYEIVHLPASIHAVKAHYRADPARNKNSNGERLLNGPLTFFSLVSPPSQRFSPPPPITFFNAITAFDRAPLQLLIHYRKIHYPRLCRHWRVLLFPMKSRERDVRRERTANDRVPSFSEIKLPDVLIRVLQNGIMGGSATPEDN